jgi:hypothetical protein
VDDDDITCLTFVESIGPKAQPFWSVVATLGVDVKMWITPRMEFIASLPVSAENDKAGFGDMKGFLPDEFS